MKREYGLENVEKDPQSFVTVGTFDGVHKGHQAIVRYVVARAREGGGKSVVITFDPHPRAVVHGQAVPLLSTVAERAAVLEGLGVDRFIVINFTKAFSQLDAEAFVESVLVDTVGLQEIIVGYDHGFGRGRKGDNELLETLGEKRGFAVDVIPPQVVEAHVVSSSEIRRQLEDGNVALAAEMLGRFYSLTGTVVPGDRRGRTIGFPTANLGIDHPDKVIPQGGVYAVRVHGAAAAVRGGMMNIGYRPTFGGETLRLEVHLFDFEGDLYGRQLRIEFVEWIRTERKFDGIAALKEQLSEDRQRCIAALKAVFSAAS